MVEITPHDGLDHAEEQEILGRLERLNAIGVALSSERDTLVLMEHILDAARDFADADGGTLYLVKDEALEFEVIRNDTLGFRMGGRSGPRIDFSPLPLYAPDGSGNHGMVVAHAALTGNTVNIPDAYAADGYDFSGTRAFDARTGYRSQSFLTVPMKDHTGAVIGVLQLINAKDSGGRVHAFTHADQQLVESLASQAAIVLTNRQLVEQLETLFESLINLINSAIDEKSPYTGGHCDRVPVLTMMLAEAASRVSVGPLADFSMSEKDRYELKIAGLLHDCGKITTPVHVVDKATKLQTLFDRIELLDARFELLLRDAEIARLKGQLDEAAFAAEVAAIDADRTLVRKSNTGGEFMDDAQVAAIGKLAQRQLTRRRRQHAAVPVGRRAREPEHPPRHADAGRARDHQPPHRDDHPHAGGAALARAPHPGARIRRRPPRAHGRQGLSTRADPRADERAGAGDGHCRHLRGAYREGPSLQEGHEPDAVAGHPRAHEARQPR